MARFTSDGMKRLLVSAILLTIVEASRTTPGVLGTECPVDINAGGGTCFDVPSGRPCTDFGVGISTTSGCDFIWCKAWYHMYANQNACNMQIVTYDVHGPPYYCDPRSHYHACDAVHGGDYTCVGPDPVAEIGAFGIGYCEDSPYPPPEGPSTRCSANPGTCSLAPSPTPSYRFVTDGQIALSQPDGNGQLDYASGIYHEKFEDVAATTFGPHLSFTRTYSSRQAVNENSPVQDSGLGSNWTFGFSSKVVDLRSVWTATPLPPEGLVKVVFDPDGQPSYYGAVEDPNQPRVFKSLDFGSLYSTYLVFDQQGHATEYFKDGSRRVFDEAGRISEVCDRNGECLVYQYSTGGKLEHVADQRTGRLIDLSYDDTEHPNLITRVAAPGGEVSYVYDIGLGIDNLPGCSEDPPDQPCNDVRLREVIAPDRIEQYTYKYVQTQQRSGGNLYDLQIDTMNVCDNEKDEQGNPTNTATNCALVGTWGFDSSTHKLSSYATPNPGTYSYSYADTYTTVTDAAYVELRTGINRSTNLPTVSSVGCSSCGGTRSYTWTQEGLLLTSTEADDDQTVYTYNAQGLLESSTRSGIQTGYTYVSVVSPGSTYGTYWLLSQEQEMSGSSAIRTTAYDYDDDEDTTPNEAPTAFLHYKKESGQTATGGSGNPSTSVEYWTTYTYYTTGDPTGLLASIYGPVAGSPTASNGAQISYTYGGSSGGANGSLIHYVVQATSPTHSLTTTYGGHDANGNPGTVTDPNVVSHTYTYDLRGRVTSDLLSGDSNATLREYDKWGNLSKLTTPVGKVTTYVADGRGRVSVTTNGAGDRTEITRNAVGLTEYEKYYNASDELVRRLHYKYRYEDPNYTPDPNPRALWKVEEGTGTPVTTSVRSYYPDGTVETTTDGDGNVTSYTYDSSNRVASATQGSGQNPPTTIYTYEGQGGRYLSEVTDANGNETDYTTDSFGRVVNVHSPDTGDTIYNYDAAGNLAFKEDSKQTSAVYSYDLANRLKDVVYNGSSQDDLHFFYDESTSQYGNGRLTKVQDGQGGVTTLAYDRAGRISSEKRNLTSVTSKTTSYAYDNDGNLTQLTYPGGRVITYSYDSASRPLGVVNGSETLASSISYEPFGPMKAMTYGNGIQTTFGHGLFYETTSIATSPSGFNRSYALFNNGNIDTITEGSDTNSFTYDALNRLLDSSVEIGSLGDFDYTYDAVGNRLSENSPSTPNYSYTNGTNHIYQVQTPLGTTVTYQHDADGNITKQTETAGTNHIAPELNLAYNLAGRLASANRHDSNHDLTFTYAYEYQGRRTTKRMPGISGPNAITRVYYYDTAGNLISEMDRNGNVIADYVFVNGQRIARQGLDPAGDADGDGMPNGYEEKYNLQVFHADANNDYDGDGVTNIDEYNDGSESTDPFDWDTDDDGYTDAQERSAGTDPTDPASNPGTSGSGPSSHFPAWMRSYEIPVGPSPKMCAKGDFDNDGHPDLAVADTGSYLSGGGSEGEVHILMGDSQGKLALVGDLTDVGKGPLFVAVKDFDGDGYEDLAVSRAGDKILGAGHSDGGGVVIYLGDGSGGFTKHAELTTQDMPYALAVGDFNHDGHPDIASANTGIIFNLGPTGVEYIGALYQTTVSIWLNDGTGSFSQPTGSPIDLGDSAPSAIVAGDFVEDENQYVDLAIVTVGFFDSGSVKGGLHVFEGDGSGHFTRVGSKLQVGSAPWAMWGAADLNGDSHLDLVVTRAPESGATARVLLGDGEGHFSPQSEVALNSSAYALGEADLNGDEEPDFLMPNTMTNEITRLLGNGSGGLTSKVTYPVSPFPRWVETADFDSDTQQDAAVVADLADLVQVLFGKGNGSFDQPQEIPTSYSPFEVVAGLFNGDSYLDLAVLHQGDQQVSIYRWQEQQGAFESEPQTGATVATGSAPFSLATGDLDHDGNKDLAWTNLAQTSFQISHGDGQGHLDTPTTVQVPNSSAVFALQVMDWNDDGRDDVVIGAYDTLHNGESGLIVMKQNNQGQFERYKAVSFGDSDAVTDIAMADFKEGGKPEFAVLQQSSSGAGKIRIVKKASGDEMEVITTLSITDGTRPFSLTAGDFDKDGHADIAVANSEMNAGVYPPILAGGSVSVFFGDGNGAFPAERRFNVGYGPMRIEAADLNGDTYPDLAIATLGKYFYNGTLDFGGLEVLISDGFRGFLGPQATPTGIYPMGLIPGNFNSDNLTDIAVTNVASKTVTVLLNQLQLGQMMGGKSAIAKTDKPGRPGKAGLKARGHGKTKRGIVPVALQKKPKKPRRAKLLAEADPTYFFHNDHLGTPQLMTDANKNVVWRANYEPFGKAHIVTEAVVNNFRFPGQYEDRESEFHQNWNRDYHAGLGRYVQADPLGPLFIGEYTPGVGGRTPEFIHSFMNLGNQPTEKQRNLYVYASDNPVREDDPNGLGGPSACQYYGSRCASSAPVLPDACGAPTDPYACQAQQCCIDFGTRPGTLCVRDCLINCDWGCTQLPPSEWAVCRFRCHFDCYWGCRGLAGALWMAGHAPWSCINILTGFGGV